MTPMDDDALDRSVRDAIEADPGTVDRVLGEALARGGRRRLPRGPLLAMAGGLALVLGGLHLSRDTRGSVQDRTRIPTSATRSSSRQRREESG
jgi:hypothetical protein